MAGVSLSILNAPQRRIAQTLDTPLFVEAGAGSGKTFTLTRRVAWALSPGSATDGGAFLDSLDQVLVITFTNAAAREIKERVRSTLRDAGMREAALAVDSAWISTIHSMCMRILKRNALDLGLDPAFSLCSNNMADVLLGQAVEDVVGAARRTAEPESALGKAFADLGFTGIVSRVQLLVQAAHANVCGFEGLWLPQGGELSGAMECLTNAFEALGGAKLSAAARKSVDPSLEALRAYAELPPGARTIEAAQETLAACKMPRSSKAIAELHAEAKAELIRAKALAALEGIAEISGDLLDLARRTDARFAELKRSESLLDNDDLITLALEAVSGNPTVAARYAGKFRLVMVDEFQDTDNKQLKLISILAGAKPGEEAAHLATVGDAQQSIYRFRGADVSVFNARGARLPKESHVRLDANYRSHADVLALVERVCGGEQGVLHGFMHLDAGRSADGDKYKARTLPRVSIEISSGPARSGYPSKEQVALMAEQIADRLCSYRDAGESAGGMALLLGATTNAAFYIDALRNRGLECVVTGGSTFTQASEVHVMLALLRTLANPRDTQSGLFPLLSSEMFELDANDFLQLGSRKQEVLDAPTKRTIDKGFASFEFFGNAEPSERLRIAHDVLMRAFSSLATTPVADVCLDVVRDSGWLSRLERLGAEGVAREANVLAAVRYIRDLTEEMGLGPVRAAAEFARWLDVSKVPPASLAGAEQDTVRVMTIHASKGLEYPVVAVAECWNNPRATSGVVTGQMSDGRTATVVLPSGLKLDGLEPQENPSDLAEWAVTLKERNAADDAQEKARLLYVALTRAREALVVGISAATSKYGVTSVLADGTLTALFGGLPQAGEGTVEYGGSAPAQVRHFSLAEESEQQTAEFLRTVSAAREEQTADLDTVELYAKDCHTRCDEVTIRRARPGVFSYSSAYAGTETLPVADAGKERPKPDAGASRQLPTRAERDAEATGEPSNSDEDKATNLGSAFHMLAQTMVETGRAPSEDRISALARRWSLSSRQRSRLDAALRRWERSSLRGEALGYGLLRAEVPFFAPVHDSEFGQFVEGAIDLLCTQGAAREGHALVVDYKTGDVGLSPEQIRARHAAQAELYANVLLSQGFSSVSCAFVCVELGRDDGEPYVVRYEFA
ncbi:MAG: UvrD-helicase domain-containing protein [Coriobacteriales bacterium]|nr:UvrD-helicase domain-containing protein [Coriobacteriales bacterium]